MVRSVCLWLALACASALRVPIIAGNWKMNPATLGEAKALASAVAAYPAKCEVVVFPPTTFVAAAVEALSEANVAVGVQDICELAAQGAFTGGVSTSMVTSVGASFALVGHSERRNLFADSFSAVQLKTRVALDAGLSVMLCVGESREEFELGCTDEVNAVQLSKALFGNVRADELARVVVAYEPVWAIGTGLSCDPDVAQNVHATIRSKLADMYDQQLADEVRILYGGSVTPETIDALMAKPDIDGVLVGGASLKAADFARIVSFEGPRLRKRDVLNKILGTSL